MALNTQLTNLAVNTEANALAPLLNGGFIDIYDGAQPATGDTPISTQTLLVSLTFAATAFGSAVNGVLTANAIGSGTAVATSTAAWFRCYESDHATAVFDGSVGTSNANCIIPSTAIATGIVVSCLSFTHTVAKSTTGS
jgi:hypothetical protein